MSGKAFAGVVAVVTLPVVARFFTPEDFGVSALFVSTMSVLATFATLGYSSAVVLPKDEEEASVLMSLSYQVLAVVCCLILLSIAVAHWAEFAVRPLDLMGASKWLLPLGLAIVAAVGIQEYWLSRKRLFRETSVSLIVGNASTGLTRIALGALGGSSSISLIAGYMFGQILRLGVQWKSCGQTVFAALKSTPKIPFGNVARRYIDFPIYKMPADFVYSIGSNLPTLLLGAMFSPAVAGLFAMAKGLLQSPVRLVSSSVSRVFLQKAASIHRDGRSLWNAYWLSTITLALTGIPVFFVVFFFGQGLTTWFLGDNWLEAGEYVETIVPWLLMVWVTVPSKAVYVVIRRQGILLMFEILLTLLRVCAFWVGYLISAGPLGTLDMFVKVTILVNFVAMVAAAYFVFGEHQRN